MKFSLFHTALILSLLVHIGIFGAMSLEKIKRINKPLKKVEITYQKIKPKKTIQPQPKFKEAKVLKEKQRQEQKRIITPFKDTRDKFTDFNQDIKDLSKMSGKIPLEKKLTPKIQIKDAKQSVSVQMSKAEKITNPKYISHLQDIRQKIYKRVDALYDKGRSDENTGNVKVSFMVSNQGSLEAAQIIDTETEAGDYLRQICLRSVREAAPFMPFPEDLPYPELTFNVVISFTIDQ